MNAFLTALAQRLAEELHAEPAPTAPARAVFEGGVIFLGVEEVAVTFDGVGTMFIAVVAGLLVVEAAALAEAGDARRLIDGRHAELARHARRLFGMDLDVRCPRRDPPAAAWS